MKLWLHTSHIWYLYLLGNCGLSFVLVDVFFLVSGILIL